MAAAPGQPAYYRQGIVAERMGYAATLYLDAAIAVLVIGLIPFLRGRDEAPADEPHRAGPAVPVPATAGD